VLGEFGRVRAVVGGVGELWKATNDGQMGPIFLMLPLCMRGLGLTDSVSDYDGAVAGGRWNFRLLSDIHVKGRQATVPVAVPRSDNVGGATRCIRRVS
jgi:hypothetical protein